MGSVPPPCVTAGLCGGTSLHGLCSAVGMLSWPVMSWDTEQGWHVASSLLTLVSPKAALENAAFLTGSTVGLCPPQPPEQNVLISLLPSGLQPFMCSPGTPCFTLLTVILTTSTRRDTPCQPTAQHGRMLPAAHGVVSSSGHHDLCWVEENHLLSLSKWLLPSLFLNAENGGCGTVVLVLQQIETVPNGG